MSSPGDSKQSEAFTDLTNTRFGDYQILRRIGTGAMADVYVAQQISLGRLIAVKILKKNLSRDETYVKRFVREAQAAARLVHPNIVHIYEVGERDGLRYIVQEYVQGINLAQYLRQHGTMTPQQVFRVMWQVASALELASQAGIVHRDIKPENILLGERFEVKVADFGLARFDDAVDQDLQLTKIGTTLGTPLYMSPEQSEGKPLDHRSDVYSFGVTCYHMLAGFPPFQGDTALSVAIQHLKSEPEMLELIRPDIPPALARIVHKMFAKTPEDRYQSLRQLKTDLKQVHAQAFRDDSVAETLVDWDTLPLDVADSSLLDVTEKLQATMILETKHLKRRRNHWVGIVLGGVLVFVLGAIFGIHKEGPQKLLELEEQALTIPQMDSVQQQWALAALRQSPEGWQSVIKYFSDEPYWKEMAKRQLAWYYFKYSQPEQAKPIFKELEQSSRSKEEAFLGTLGQAWINAEAGNLEEAQRLLKVQQGAVPERYDEMASEMIDTLRRKFHLTVPLLPGPGIGPGSRRQ